MPASNRLDLSSSFVEKPWRVRCEVGHPKPVVDRFQSNPPGKITTGACMPSFR
jgi:hypothetical protein